MPSVFTSFGVRCTPKPSSKSPALTMQQAHARTEKANADAEALDIVTRYEARDED